MTIGSAVVTPELLDAVERALPHIKVSESYGLTEGGSPLRAPIDGRPVPRGSPGVPAPEIEVKLIDANGNDADDEGELLIRCPYVCLGYYNEPEITRAKLIDGWLRTGDIFCKDKDGFFYFRSRVDDMFSCGGENVYPKEVENLLFAHPDVVNAVVAPVPHPVKGFVPAAMVMAREGSAITADELKAYCLDKGPAYSHPRFIDIVGALPLNGAGKIDRSAVQAKLNAAYGAKEAGTNCRREPAWARDHAASATARRRAFSLCGQTDEDQESSGWRAAPTPYATPGNSPAGRPDRRSARPSRPPSDRASAIEEALVDDGAVAGGDRACRRSPCPCGRAALPNTA